MSRFFRAARIASVAGILGVAALGLTGCVVVSGCSMNWQPAKFKGPVSASTPAVAGKGVEATTANGAITVEAGDVAEVQISGEARATTAERLAQIKILAERDAEGNLKVSVVWPAGGRQGSEGCDLKVVTPRVAWAKLRSSNGAIAARGLAGEATLESSNGSIQVHGHEGNLKLSTSNGDITADGVIGSITADTSNGSIDIDLAGGAGATINADSSNGSIDVSLPADFAGTLDCSTSNGKVINSTKGTAAPGTAKSRATITLGSGGGVSKISTSNGGVTITQK